MCAGSSVFIKKVSLLLLALLAVAAGYGLYYLHADYTRVFLRNRAGLAGVREESLGSDPVFDNYNVFLLDSKGGELACMVRSPRNTKDRLPAILVIDGYDSGGKVVSLFESTKAVLVSFDWPDDRGYKYQGTNIGPFLAGIRRSLIRMVCAIPLVVDYLETRPDVDPEKIIMLGASLGVPAAVNGAAIDTRFRAAILLYGGGDISRMMENSARSTIPEAWKRTLVSWWVEAALAPIEPLKYIGRISPRPVLMINGKDDASIPGDCVMSLYREAKEPKDLIWLETGHVQPELAELILRLEGIITLWLGERGIWENTRPQSPQ